MISHHPIVLEHESNGSVSAYVVGLPGVFAAADSERAAGEAIRVALRAHLTALQALPPLGRAKSALSEALPAWCTPPSFVGTMMSLRSTPAPDATR